MSFFESNATALDFASRLLVTLFHDVFHMAFCCCQLQKKGSNSKKKIPAKKAQDVNLNLNRLPAAILLMAEILHHLGCMKPYK